MLTNTNQLNDHQLDQLEQLRLLCKKVDDSTPNLYPHILAQARTIPASLLYYDKDQLVGFLGVYFFYDDAVEVSVLINPLYRRQGIAQHLLNTIMPIIQTQGYDKLIFSNPAQLNNLWLGKHGFTYMHSEYYMERNDLNPLLNYTHPLTFRSALIEDIPQLCAIDEMCFAKTQSEAVERYFSLIEDREYEIILAFKEHHLIGKAHIRWQKNGATLSDIAVIPPMQGKGLGSTLITHCVNFSLGEGKPLLNLDVETHNKRALALYTRLGFTTQNACDYWSIDMKQLIKA